MNASLDKIRSDSASDIHDLLVKLDDRHKALLRAAIRKYGRVQNIPDAVLASVFTDDDKAALATAIILLMTSTDRASEAELASMGIGTDGARTEVGMKANAMSSGRYALAAHSRVDGIAKDFFYTTSSRLARKVEDSRLTGPGALGELTDAGLDTVIDDVFNDARRKQLVTDATTDAVSTARIETRNRVVGGDGASTTVDGMRMTVAIIWHTHPEATATGPCPRCAPLDGQPESVWSLVFLEGPGDDAHKGCACTLEYRLVPYVEDSE